MADRTIGTGQTHSTIADWASTVKALGTLTEDEVGLLEVDEAYTYGAQSDLNFSSVTLDGFTITLRGSGSGVHDGTTSSGARVVTSVSFGGIYRPTDCILEDFIVENTSTSGGARCFISADGVTFNRMVVKTASTANNSQPFHTLSGASADTCTFHSCLAIGGQDNFELNKGTEELYNCTGVDAGTNGIQAGSSNTGTIRNCVVFNAGTTDWSGTFSGTYSNNASEDGTHPGTSGQTITSADFVDTSTGDYTPADGGDLDGTGTATGQPSLDLESNSWVTNDIGALIAEASGTSIIPLIMNYRRMSIG